MNLVKQLSNRNLPQNFVVSPFAVRQALVLLYLGKGTRKDYQLARALRMTGRQNGKIVSYFGKARFKAIKQEFTMANRIYLSPSYNDFEQMKKLSGNLGVDVENMKFSENTKSGDEIKNVQETLDLNVALQALGIKKIFTDDDEDSNATVASFKQFSALESKPNRVLMSADFGGDNDQRVVNVNKPFVFVIKDQSTVYMVGRIEAIR
ncbi:hypothetical protein M5D96_005613 [Drosophila gunungcola]|uniref:Serpin domain-containing protein n=1 Tax=Drosophila gunungcola TaxID=103775 RepID=A0A9P9YR31_9MUSC|nr:hypothetical protein M5D96_005613 [Drosophila gunungcola]